MPRSQYQEVINRHPDVFEDEFGKVQGTKAKFYLRSDVTPKSQGGTGIRLFAGRWCCVMAPIQFSDWATPIVPVIKKYESVRICGDYKLTINQVVKTDSYPLPRIQDLFDHWQEEKHSQSLTLLMRINRSP